MNEPHKRAQGSPCAQLGDSHIGDFPISLDLLRLAVTDTTTETAAVYVPFTDL
jgi:hypothetical protein